MQRLLNHLEDLYRQHIVMVRRQATRVLGDATAAEDVAQEVFVNFVLALRRGAVVENVPGYLFRSATFGAIRSLQRGRAQIKLVALAALAEEGATEHTNLLRDTMRQSSPRDAEVAGYFYFADMTQDDIAQLLGMTRHDVRRHLQRFVERARAAVRSTPHE